MAIVVNNKPNLEFSFLGGNLLVKDYLEEYDGLDLANYICVDYITYKDKIVNTNIIEITNIHDIEEVSFTLANDGIHEYYRLVVPKIDKYLNSGQIDPYNVFYYNGGFYYTLETVWTDEIDTNSFKKVELSSLYKLLEKEIGIPLDGFKGYGAMSNILLMVGLSYPFTRMKKIKSKVSSNMQRITENMNARQTKMFDKEDLLGDLLSSKQPKQNKNDGFNIDLLRSLGSTETPHG